MKGAEDDVEQSLIGHLIELRTRLMRTVFGILGILLCLVPFANKLYSVLALPLLASLPNGGQMIAIDPIAPFLTPLKFAFFLALVVGAPWILFQIWGFVAPGLYRHERKLAIPLLVSATLLFYLGCAFAYFLVLPTIFTLMNAIAPEGVTVMTDIGKYLDFVLVLFLAFGVTFEVPVATVIIVRLGWVTVAQLKEARPYLIVAAFVIAAVITPPDIASQLLLAIPMCILFEIGLIAAKALEPKEQAASKTES